MATNTLSSTRVAVFAKPNSVSAALVSKLRDIQCTVVFISGAQQWKAYLGMEGNSDWAIFTDSPASAVFNYILVCGEFPRLLNSKTRSTMATEKEVESWLVSARDMNSGNLNKLICVLPLSESKKTHLSNLITKTVFLGNVFSPAIDVTSSDETLSKIFSAVIQNKEVVVPSVNDTLPVVYLNDAVEQVVRLMFSYWNSDEEFTVAQLETYKNINDLLHSAGFVVSMVEKPGVKKFSLHSSFLLKKQTANALQDTIHLLPRPLPKIETVTKTVVARKPNVVSQKPRRKWRIDKISKSWVLGFISIVIVLVLFSPFLSFFLGGAFMGIGYKYANKGRFGNAATWIHLSTKAARFSQKTFSYYTGLPGIGKKFGGFARNVDFLVDADSLADTALGVAQDSTTLISNILSNKEYDLANSSHSLAINLDTLYKQTSFLEGQLPQVTLASKYFPTKLQIDSLKKYLLVGRDMASQLPALISAGEPQSYLILLQNNMELRPTGGFIGSFALVTFDNGRLIDLSVYDVYTADGQLKGHIEPPTPIKDYLGEANWYLRDSNWDPDFQASATRAEWFVEKELDRKVNGVVSLDIEVIKDMLKVFGPVKLADFSMTVTDQNLYEKLQHEVESTFFPGSQKKATLLTALAQALMEKTNQLSQSQILPLGKDILTNLDNRHIQVMLHNTYVAQALKESRWSGELLGQPCGQACSSAWVGMNEANVGVNKANYYLDRSAKLTLSLSNGQIDYTLSVLYKNKSSQELALGGRYKAYVRALALPGSSFANVSITGGGENTSISPQISGTKNAVEAGVLVEVPPLSAKIVTFRWSTPTNIALNSPGNLAFTWQKQAGTKSDPVQILFVTTGDRRLFADPSFTLTQGSAMGYNATLVRDFSTVLHW